MLNSHMMKNNEWGAVAYLSRSKYGNNSQVSSGGSNYTGGGTNNHYTTYTSASTTGTVYGVYDMNGGAYEYVAAYINNGDSNLTSYGSSLINGDSKTKNVYSKADTDDRESNYNQNAGVYGDAIYETSSNANSSQDSWYIDYVKFPSTRTPFFTRGGSHSNHATSGVFSLSHGTGVDDKVVSFRPVLIVI